MAHRLGCGDLDTDKPNNNLGYLLSIYYMAQVWRIIEAYVLCHM